MNPYTSFVVPQLCMKPDELLACPQFDPNMRIASRNINAPLIYMYIENETFDFDVVNRIMAHPRFDPNSPVKMSRGCEKYVFPLAEAHSFNKARWYKFFDALLDHPATIIRADTVLVYIKSLSCPRELLLKMIRHPSLDVNGRIKLNAAVNPILSHCLVASAFELGIEWNLICEIFERKPSVNGISDMMLILSNTRFVEILQMVGKCPGFAVTRVTIMSVLVRFGKSPELLKYIILLMQYTDHGLIRDKNIVLEERYRNALPPRIKSALRIYGYSLI